MAATAALLPACGVYVATNPPEPSNPSCPAEQPKWGEPCADAALSCPYEVDYGCGPQPETAKCENGAWVIEGVVSCNPPPPGECPAEAPMSGEPCLNAGLSCSYEIDIGCGPQPATATCENGAWTILESVSCNPPPPDYCSTYTVEAECGAEPSCRWLVPGCGEPALPKAGCFAIADCVSDGDCSFSGGTCQKADINPCYNKACDACGMTVSVCLPPPP